MRRVILHYHLFKNAGTSLDHVLQQNFWGRWATAEFSMRSPNTAQIAQWISGMPDVVAFSSHTMVGPIPRIPGIKLTPVVLLRDPVDRIFSAYRFERQQRADTYGAQLARAQDFAGYVHARLARKGDRQCRNFQTSRLASMVPGSASEIDRAKEALHLVQGMGTLGLVSAFPQALIDLKSRIATDFPNFSPVPSHRNTSAPQNTGNVPAGLWQLLAQANRMDAELLDTARQILGKTRSIAV